MKMGKNYLCFPGYGRGLKAKYLLYNRQMNAGVFLMLLNLENLKRAIISLLVLKVN